MKQIGLLLNSLENNLVIIGMSHLLSMFLFYFFLFLMTLGPGMDGTHGRSGCSGKTIILLVPPCQEYRVTIDSTEELVWDYFKLSLIQGFWDQQLAQRTQSDAKLVWIWNFLLHVRMLQILAIFLPNFCNEACVSYILVSQLSPQSWSSLLHSLFTPYGYIRDCKLESLLKKEAGVLCLQGALIYLDWTSDTGKSFYRLISDFWWGLVQKAELEQFLSYTCLLSRKSWND